MITYKINYKKGQYEVIGIDTERGAVFNGIKTNNLESMCNFVESHKGENFFMTISVPKDIKEMLLKYRNVL